MTRNVSLLIVMIERFVDVSRIGIGISRTISMSKTIKIIANRKNRMENGIRALWFGSNPHSNGDDFSRDGILRAEILYAMVNKITGSIVAVSEEIINMFIN